SRVDHALVVVRAGVAGEVPGTFDEGIHGVGFAPCRLVAAWAGAFIELGHPGQRAAGAVRHYIFGQHHGQSVVRHRNVTAVGAVDDRDRATPIALTADAPVAQAELGARRAQFLLLEHFTD